MEHAKIDDQIFSPLSTATGGGTVELPTTGAQLQARPHPRPSLAPHNQCPMSLALPSTYNKKIQSKGAELWR